MNVIRKLKIICLIFPAAYFAGCGGMYGDFFNDPDNTGEVQWATPMKSVSEFGSSGFNGVAVDDSGNTYAVGFTTAGTFDFGGTSVAFDTNEGPSVIVKYNSSGVAQWAVKPESYSKGCAFQSVAVDTQGNVYAAGYVQDSGTFQFGGNSDQVTGKSTFTAVIVKYNSSGIAQWATQVYSASNRTIFNAIALDEQGNIYAVGDVVGTNFFDFGGISTGFTAPDSSYNAVIVKYDAYGKAQWATPIKKSVNGSWFTGVATDKSGNVYAVGIVTNTGEFDFVGGSDTAFNGKNGGFTAVIVKYNPSGVAQWATPIKTSPAESQFNGVAVDRSGNIFTVGHVVGSDTFDFGGDSDAFTGKSAGYNAVIVKYNASGIALWASSVETAPEDSIFNAVSVDVLGNAYAVGYVCDIGSFFFGGNSSPITGKTNNENTVIVKYNELGIAQWAKTVNAVEGTGTACTFSGVAVDGSGYAYAVGKMTGLGTFYFGGKSNPSPNGNTKTNTIIVKYY